MEKKGGYKFCDLTSLVCTGVQVIVQETKDLGVSVGKIKIFYLDFLKRNEK